MVCEAGHVDAAETGQKVALLVEVRVAWDLRVVGTWKGLHLRAGG